MMRVVRLKSFFWLTLFLFSAYNLYGQKLKTTETSIDTIPLTTPTISATINCDLGIAKVVVEFENKDSSLYNTQLNLYSIKDLTPQDTIADTLNYIKSFSFKELEKNNFKIVPKKEGVYTVRVEKDKENGEKKFSAFSNKVSILYCSALEFDAYFDKVKTQSFTPKKLFNIQVIEFSVFDRIGETVYLHNNNNISWQGNFTNGQQCPNGIYYYHCEYIDIANDSKKKTMSGMIELKNSN